MGLLEKIFGKAASPKVAESSAQHLGYQTMTEYNPIFTSYHGSLYGQELTRAAIERFASACSKLKPEVSGSSLSRGTSSMFLSRPNSVMTWPTFLQIVATHYECDSTAFIVPSFARDMMTVTGIYPVTCEFAEVVDCDGEPWIKFHFSTGRVSAIELSSVCILSKFQYRSQYFGEPNCLDQTMQLIHAQAQAQESAIQNGAKIRFIAAVEGQMRPEDMKKKREQFVEDTLGTDNSGGLALYDNTFRDLKQIEPKSYVIDDAEMKRIEANVYTYFGINESILHNDYDEDTWGAWYEGKVEPFAIKLGEGLTSMLFTPTQAANGSCFTFSSNRLEYASNASKRNMIRDMLDRGVLTINQALEILQMPPIGEEGDVRVIRGEYVNAAAVSSTVDETDSEKKEEDEDTEEKDAVQTK